MPTRFAAITLAALLVMLAGCSLTGEEARFPRPIDFSTLSQDSTLLVGTWQWERSTVYGPGSPSNGTPASTGQTETLVFEEGGTYERYRDGRLEERSGYHVERFCREGDEQYCWFRLFLNGRAERQWGVSADTLAFSSAPVDGPETVYMRAAGSE